MPPLLSPHRLPLPALLGLCALAAACSAAAPPDSLPAAPDEDRSVFAHDNVLTRDQIVRINATRIEQLFEGRFSGVQVLRRGNGEVSLRIRTSSTSANDEPLFVIDGIPQSGGRGLTGLSPYDIAQIEILKDAAASEYGLRGANGVVVISTRWR